MALPSSGEISARDINGELERQASDQLSQLKACDGFYATINTASASYPDTNKPLSYSEWHGYDHSASSWSLTNSLSHDGVNDWSRFTGSSYANICQVFDGGGTIVIAFNCTGTTSSSNQYVWQGAWGGGWNWLLQVRDFSGSNFQIRFRHDFSGNNYSSEPATSTGQKPFSTNTWYFVCLTYNNASTSNNATWYYGDYGGTSLTTVSSPVEITAPTGSKRSMSAQYPSISGAKGSATTRPFKGNATMVSAWSDILTSSEVTTLFNSGSPYQMSNHSDNLLFFHDMASVSGSTVTPETGGTGYTIGLNNGASQSTTIPS